MATQEERKSRLAHLPGILGSSAALIAALTTVYVNLRGDRHEAAAVSASAPAPTAAAAPGAGASAVTTPPAATRPLRAGLQLDRIRVDNDGSMGTTDWVFEVDAVDRPLFTLPMKGLSDREGDNLSKVGDPQQASAEFDWPPARTVKLQVKGWKRGLLAGGRAPEVEGEAWLADNMGTVAVTAKSANPDGPAFVFYFSVTSDAGAQR